MERLFRAARRKKGIPMRSLISVLVLIVLGFGFESLRASEGFDGLSVRAKEGATEEELLTYALKANVAYELTVDEIFLLSDLGYTPKTISAIADVGKAVRMVNAEKAAALTQKEVVPAEAAVEPVQPETVLAAEAVADPAVRAEAPVLKKIVTSNGEELAIEETVDLPPSTVDVVAPADDEVTVGTFISTLAPYGSWVRIRDRGWYWRPTVCITDTNWRPYCDRGHWAWTDCNWCWQSDYSWGWAPFHYGRWSHCPGYGWLWMPDTHWSPAWVSWRGSESHYGWAPLPWGVRCDPGLGLHFGGKHYGADFGFGLTHRDFTFCPRDHFCDTSLRAHVIHSRENENRFKNTPMLQNNIEFHENHVVVNGPAFEHVQKVTGELIKQLNIADASIKPGERLTRVNREDRANGTLTLYRPPVKEPTLPNAALTTSQANAERIERAVRANEQRTIEANERTRARDTANGTYRPYTNLGGVTTQNRINYNSGTATIGNSVSGGQTLSTVHNQTTAPHSDITNSTVQTIDTSGTASHAPNRTESTSPRHTVETPNHAATVPSLPSHTSTPSTGSSGAANNSGSSSNGNAGHSSGSSVYTPSSSSSSNNSSTSGNSSSNSSTNKFGR